jgi:hypothetical protein
VRCGSVNVSFDADIEDIGAYTGIAAPPPQSAPAGFYP